MDIRRYGCVNEPGRPRMSLGLAHGSWVTVCAVAPSRAPDVAHQTREVLELLEAYLTEMGSSKAQLLTATVWLKDMADYAAMNAEWNAWVDEDNPPVRSCVRADMARPEMLVEIRLTAAR